MTRAVVHQDVTKIGMTTDAVAGTVGVAAVVTEVSGAMEMIATVGTTVMADGMMITLPESIGMPVTTGIVAEVEKNVVAVEAVTPRDMTEVIEAIEETEVIGVVTRAHGMLPLLVMVNPGKLENHTEVEATKRRGSRVVIIDS